MQHADLNHLFGNIDLHLLDQLLKGRYQPGMRLLDAGCGEGRNLPYFVRNGYDLWGVDTNPVALRLLRMQGRSWHPTFDPEKFIESDITELPFPPTSLDAVLCLSVLHFASDEAHFFRMTDELLRVLKPLGSLLIRTNACVESSPLGLRTTNERPDSDEGDRLLLTSALLNQLIERYSLTWLEPMRTEEIAGERALVTLVLQKD